MFEDLEQFGLVRKPRVVVSINRLPVPMGMRMLVAMMMVVMVMVVMVIVFRRVMVVMTLPMMVVAVLMTHERFLLLAIDPAQTLC